MRFTLGLACGLSLLTAVPVAQGQSGDFLAALVATRSSDATSATAYLADALKKDPQESELIRQQLRILTIEGDFDAALPYAQDFLSIDPEDPLASNILRIGAWELLFVPEVPPKVSINEGIELGKRFSTANTGAFVNGILDKVRQIAHDREGATEGAE